MKNICQHCGKLVCFKCGVCHECEKELSVSLEERVFHLEKIIEKLIKEKGE